MEDTVKTRRNPLAWFSKHKKLTALLLVVLIAAVLVLRAVLGGKKAAGSTYQFVRTSTLQKTSLTDSVSVNGTVKSGYEASVTVADSAKLYKVSEVKVAVGDTVKKGRWTPPTWKSRSKVPKKATAIRCNRRRRATTAR